MCDYTPLCLYAFINQSLFILILYYLFFILSLFNLYLILQNRKGRLAEATFKNMGGAFNYLSLPSDYTGVVFPVSYLLRD